jgi:hypothetical protein
MTVTPEQIEALKPGDILAVRATFASRGDMAGSLWVDNADGGEASCRVRHSAIVSISERPIEPGDTVSHPTYGPGTVKAVGEERAFVLWSHKTPWGQRETATLLTGLVRA